MDNELMCFSESTLVFLAGWEGGSQMQQGYAVGGAQELQSEIVKEAVVRLAHHPGTNYPSVACAGLAIECPGSL